MISENSQRLMQTLLEFGYEGAHREALLQRLPFSMATFYRAIKPLLQLGLVAESSPSYYVLPLAHPHNFAFKLWNDQQRLLSLPASVRDEVYGLLQRIRSLAGENMLALWLHGSAAQNSLGESSDFDFVIVTSKELELDLRASRTVQLTVFTEKRFRRLFSEGDPFLRTLISHGLLLLDRDFAQSYYTQPLPTPSQGQRKERDELLEQLRQRLLFAIREEAPELGVPALRALAIEVTRSLLYQLQELPAGKDDVLDLAAFYFGPAYAQLLTQCLDPETPQNRWHQLLDELDHWREQFLTQADTIRRILSALRSSEAQLEQAIADALEALTGSSILGQAETSTADRRYDLALKTQTGPVYIELKSSRGALAEPFLSKTLDDLKTLQAPAILILNQYRDVPLWERPSLTHRQLELAAQSQVALLDTVELAQAWLQLTLGQQPALPSALSALSGAKVSI